MSDDFEDKAADVPAGKVARKRPAPRKVAKAKPAAAAAEPVPAPVEDRTEAPAEPAAEVRGEPEPRHRDFAAAESAPEPIPFFVENTTSEPPGNSKKRRRRKKKGGQGQGPHAQAGPPSGDPPPAAAEATPPAPVMHAAPRPKLDGDEVAKKAWKIFQSEVGEEGLALIDDHDAREISRRCFRLAEIFLEEAARRHR
jgi:hypothetical protein